VSYDADNNMTEFQELSVAPPRVTNVSDRRFAVSLWFLPAAIAAIVLIVREMARMERTLSAEGEKSSRVLVYDLPTGETLHVPLESGTEVIRIVAHARGGDNMSLITHGAHLSMDAHGNRGERKETIELAMPGTRSRARAEEPDIAVADPLGFDVDVHGIGRGELEVKLDSIDGAQGMLVRIYRRELLDQLEVVRRERVLDEKHENHLASRSWEIDWSDLDELERAELLEGRWRKVGLVRGSKELAVHAIAISAGQQKALTAYHPPLVSSMSLVQGETDTIFTAGAATLYVDTENPATVQMKREDGSVDRVVANGRFELHTVPRTGVEIETMGAVSIRTDDPAAVETPIIMRAWRATTTRPIVIDGEGANRVIRVAARRSVPRGWTAPVALDLTAAFTTAGTNARLGFPLHGNVAPSTFDRFTGDITSASEAPTQKLVTHALLSPGKTVTFVPGPDPVDIALGELDPDAAPRMSEARPIGAPLPIANANDETWAGFLPRRPTNAAQFGVDESHLVRIARRIVPYVKTPEHAITRVSNPPKDVRMVDNRAYEKAGDEPYVIQTDGDAHWLTLRFIADAPCDVTARIDGGKPRRKLEGLAQHVTVTHSIHVPQGESAAVVVLGDDLDVGTHELTLQVAPGTAWVHVPWIRPRKAKKQTTPQNTAPKWVGGDFDN
jgi:hypothetical protein